ncbi:hypothetical protein LCGC14_0922000 [marine sediment metagenome]|uniref:Uncharacterized protein n=1 Tax=marine sediment metagenome TaxID=412755 RepID=A0A0F9NVD8_9ZZZZ
MGRLAELIAQEDLSSNEREELKDLVEILEGLLAAVDIVDSSGQTTFQGPSRHYREAFFHTDSFSLSGRAKGIRMINSANTGILGYMGMRDNANGDLLVGINDSATGETSIAFSQTDGGQIYLNPGGAEVLRILKLPADANHQAIWGFAGSTGGQLALADSAGFDDVFISFGVGGGGEETVFNDRSYDVDFRIEGDTVDDVFKVDAGEDKVIIGGPKSTTGDPTGQEGMLYINTFDNAVRMYADGAWRSLATW